jgi:hypothetical protein
LGFFTGNCPTSFAVTSGSSGNDGHRVAVRSLVVVLARGLCFKNIALKVYLHSLTYIK